MFTDKASPAGPRHTHIERGATEGEERRRGRQGNKGRENWRRGARGATGECLLAAPFSQECRCDRLPSISGPTQIFSALSYSLEFCLGKI